MWKMQLKIQFAIPFENSPEYSSIQVSSFCELEKAVPPLVCVGHQLPGVGGTIPVAQKKKKLCSILVLKLTYTYT